MAGTRQDRFDCRILGVICGVCSFFYAESLGGKSTVERFATLLADDPLTVYEKSARMDMVTGALDTLLVEYPLGAGLGRWGMMRSVLWERAVTLIRPRSGLKSNSRPGCSTAVSCF